MLCAAQGPLHEELSRKHDAKDELHNEVAALQATVTAALTAHAGENRRG